MMISASIPSHQSRHLYLAPHYLSLFQADNDCFSWLFSFSPTLHAGCCLILADTFGDLVPAPQATCGFSHGHGAQFHVSSDSCWQCLISCYSERLCASGPSLKLWESVPKLSSAWSAREPVAPTGATLSQCATKANSNHPTSCPSFRQFWEDSNMLFGHAAEEVMPRCQEQWPW